MTKILSGKSNVDLDYPICRPSLDLDFTHEELDPRVTFTRANTATRVNRNRVIETVGVNVPRFDYDPVTGECRGLLIEESRTNNVFASDRVDASWLITVSGGSGTFIDGEKVTSSVLSVDATYDASLSTSSTFILRNSLSGQPYGTLTGLTSGATRTINSQINIGGQVNVSAFLTTETTAPDGSFNACLVTPTTVSSSSRVINKRFTTSTAGTYTFSIFFKNKNITNNLVAIYIGNQTSLSNVYANFNVYAKTFSTGQTGGWTGNVGYQDYANGWGRIWVTATTTASSHTFLDCSLWIGGYQGTYTSVGSLYAWGMQLETGAFPTSYIPTTKSTATRSADRASITGTNFSTWYNQTEGSVVTAFQKNSTFSYNFGAFSLTSSLSDRLNVIDYFPSAFTIYYGGKAQVYEFGGPGNVTEKIKGAFSFTTNKFSKCVNGTLYSTFNGTPITSGIKIPTVDRLVLGPYWSGVQPLNGTMSRFTYYPRALKPNQLQYLTQ